ncbi:S-type pyocin domain-containing protein [Pseudomonas soli]|uniref:S-type pyocin domain-containing protein n=1 Tax=Pseudomonas soli TaxID=1306993 RepID=UPI0038086D22
MSDPVEDGMIYRSANGFENSHRAQVAESYTVKLQDIINRVNVEVATIRAGATGKLVIDRLQTIKSSLERLLAETVQKRDQRNVLALSYNGLDPTLYNPIRSQPGFWTRDAYSYKQNTLKWASSYDAFHDAKLFGQAINLIKQHLSALEAEVQAALAHAAQQMAHAVREQIAGQLAAIATPAQAQMAHHAAGVIWQLTQLSARITAEAHTANQSGQHVASQTRHHISALAPLTCNQLCANEVGQIVASAQADVEAIASRYTIAVNSRLGEFTRFLQERRQAIDSAVNDATSQILARQNELNAQVHTSPTNDSATAALQSLRNDTAAMYANAGPQLDQIQAAVSGRVDETLTALRTAQVDLKAQLQALPGKAQGVIARSANTYRFPANAGSLLSVPGQGVFPLTEAVASLGQTIAQAIAEIGRVAAAGPGAYFATFLALLTYSSSTADDAHDHTPDRIRYGLGVEAEVLGLAGGNDLNAIAQARGTVELAWRLTNDTQSDGRSYVSVVNADGVKIPRSVAVRAAALDPQTGLYSLVVPSLVADEPAITLTWTPVSPPGNHSPTSATPLVTQNVPLYTGVELEPQAVTAQAYPGIVPALSDLIITFPADSGLQPVYVMFSEPLDSGIFTRKQLDRKYKHAKSFGITASQKNSETLSVFRDAILAHLKEKNTLTKGTYLYEKDSTVHFNSTTLNVVILSASGDFISGWKLTPETPQYETYISTGVLK